MKRKEKVLLGTKKKRRRDVAPPSSRALRSVINPVHVVYPNPILTHPKLVIIFFHGIVSKKDITKAWKETWTSTTHINGEEPTFWIKEWLVEDMGENIQILSLSYDTNIYGVNGDVTNIGKNLVQSLVVNRSYENLWCAPIVLVGHSFGGLIIKSLVVEIQRYMNQKTSNDIESAMNARSKDFYDNLTGVIFYGAPHEGGTKTFSMYFVEICQEVGLLNKTHSITQQSFLQNVQVLDQKMEQLSVDFDQTKENLNIYAFVEGQPINQNEEILVSPASAQRLSRNNYYKIEDANHLTICKPPTRDHISYSKLVDCLKICLKLGCVNVQHDMSCCEGLNNAMTTLGSYVHNTFVRSNIKHIGDKNLI
ncbi:unnamed protein product [Sphagnum balticum]